jgi:hypothetical protein
MIAVFFIIALFNFFVGFYTAGLFYGNRIKLQSLDEELTYCHGYEDGIYYAIGEAVPELFQVEIAQKAYREYKGLKHGPTKH